MADLSVIIVSYNVRKFLEQALLSVQKASKGLVVETIVVDNASSDDSCEVVKEKYPWAKLIENKDNVGFSKANNQGIKASKGKYVLLLNPDTVVAEDTFEKCLAFMEKTPNCGALGVRMIDGSGKFLPESKRGLPTPKASFYKIFGLASLFPKSETFGSYHLKYLSEFETNPVEVLSGAFMFMRKEALDKAGLLDEDFFMYGEDIDLSYRISKTGFQNYYFPETTIIHYKGESTKKNSINYVKVFYQAMIIFANKHFSVKMGKWFGVMIYMAVYLRAFLSICKRVYKKSLPVFTEFAILYLSFFGITRYWEEYNKWVEGGAYPTEYFVYHLSAYTLVLLSSLGIAGAYRNYFSGNNLWRGFFIGFTALVIAYSLLPETLRYSRAIVILGAFLGFAILGLYRSVVNFIKNKTFSLGNTKQIRTLVVGSEESFERAKAIIYQSKKPVSIIGRIAVEESDKSTSVGTLKDLMQCVGFYKPNELIFSSSDLANSQIISHLSQQNKYKSSIKILPQDCSFIIGSNDKNALGDYYSIDSSYKLSLKSALINKRLFDIFCCLLLFPILPFMKIKGSKKWKSWGEVFWGRKTWVGYNKQISIEKLPKIKAGVFEVYQEEVSNIDNQKEFIEKANQYYALHYSLSMDIDTVSKAFS